MSESDEIAQKVIACRRYITAINKAVAIKIDDLIGLKDKHGRLGRHHREELDWLTKVITPPLDRLSENWNTLVDHLIRLGDK